jgi:hypothetical protein
MILTLLLFIPFAVNIIVLIQYIYTRNPIYRKKFILTVLTGSGLLGGAVLLSLFVPAIYDAFDFAFLFWVLSGYLTVLSLCVKILIFRRVYLRYQDPQNFYYNFFGKKVMHSGFLTNKEMGNFILTIPLLLVAGVYFTARLINLIMHGHL